MIISPDTTFQRLLCRRLAAAAAVIGSVAWVVCLRAGLVLSHYDAKAHLVVARRVIDSLTPGWQQIGAVWLPLPHLIEVLPVQIDVFYRTGAFGSFVSIACLAVTVFAIARLVLSVTGSPLGAVVGAALFTLNPNVLYLHTTPMTEPLLLAASMLVVLWLFEWVRDRREVIPGKLAATLFLAVWTRYEAWPVVGAALAASGFAMWRDGDDLATVCRKTCRLAVWPALAIGIFLVNSEVTVGEWFVSGGFFVPDPTYAHQLFRTLVGIWWGTHELSGYLIEAVALGAAAVVAWRAARRVPDAALLVLLAPFAAAALPLAAFYDGHPYRIRYMIPLVGACALFGGLAVGLLGSAKRPSLVRGARLGLAIGLLVSLAAESPFWGAQAPMLIEAQWDQGASLGRRDVTACLARDYRGELVLASMGSLAHYMQELSNSGFDIADFIHEGNGVIWNAALETGPARHAGWMLVEEVAEGGDVLAMRLRSEPAFGKGMARVCEGGGVALYRRLGS